MRNGPHNRPAGRRAAQTEAGHALLYCVAAALRLACPRPPIVGELASLPGLPRPVLRKFLGRGIRLGLLVQVAPNRWYLPAVMVDLLAHPHAHAHVQALADVAGDGCLDAASYRDRTGTGIDRNLTVQVLKTAPATHGRPACRRRVWRYSACRGAMPRPRRAPCQPR